MFFPQIIKVGFRKLKYLLRLLRAEHKKILVRTSKRKFVYDILMVMALKMPSTNNPVLRAGNKL